MKPQNTKEWLEYQEGIDYKTKINLFEEVSKNERFYAGDQWNGVVANNLPTPVFNFLKRALQYKISAVTSDNTTMKFSAENVSDNPNDEREAMLIQVADILTNYAETTKENLKFNYLNSLGLKDACISGDYIAYYYWDSTIDTGQDAKGDICCELIDNVNLFLGNPNDNRINYMNKPVQPYIIIAFRELVSKLKEEAKNNGISKQEIEKITPDEENNYQSGDRGKIELDTNSKTIALLKMWYNPKTKTIWAKKCTKFTEIRTEYDTELTIYPIAIMNWETRKNCCHGVAEVSGLIPNQIFVNKAFAMAMLSSNYFAFPKLVYSIDSMQNQTITNSIGGVYAVTGNTTGVMQYITPEQIATGDLYKIIEMTMQYTKELMGATDSALGEVDPKNTSAIIAVQKASSIPLRSVKDRFNNFVEDVGLIWLDFWLTKYNSPRKLTITRNGVKEVVEIDLSQFKDIKFKLKIDVGASSEWSEITAIQTLDALLEKERIDFIEYLERLPDGLIPRKQELLDKRQEMQQQVEQMQQQQYNPQELEQLSSGLSPEELNAVQQNPEVLDQLLQGGGGNGMPQMQMPINA